MPHSAPVTDEPAYPSRRSLRESRHPRVENLRTRTGSVRLPLVEHVPAIVVTDTPANARKIPLRRRLAGAAAAASVCGLTLTLGLPMVQQTTPGAEAGAGAVLSSQQLFSEVSLDEIPPSLTEISAADISASAPIDYTFYPDALVNYPFAATVTLTDGFGYRTAPVEQFHDAQDFAAAAGTPVQAIADGTVLEAGFASDGCGFGLKLEHELDGKEVTSRYCHMEMGSHSLAVGDAVTMGDQIGRVGNTGMSFGAHLHLAIRIDDEPADPMPFFREYTRKTRTSESSKTAQASQPTAQPTTAPAAAE